MQRVPKPRRALFCSFCGKGQHEVHDLLAGPNVMICNECVADAARILAERSSRPLELVNKPNK